MLHRDVAKFAVVGALSLFAACAPERPAVTAVSVLLNESSEENARCDLNVGAGKSYAAIQAAINAAVAGNTICVYPGVYNEAAPGSTSPSIGGTYQFGLFFPSTKPGLKLVGVDASAHAVTDARATLATINTDATNNFGTSGIFIDAANTTIQGVKIGPNLSGDNKTIEVIADNFTLRYATTAIPAGGGSVYINDYSAASDVVKSYHVLDNLFADGTSVDVASGAGVTGPVSGREILRNTFDLGLNGYNAISFSGTGGVAWFAHPVGGAVIRNNSFKNSSQYIRARGVYHEAEFDWSSYWNDNTFDRAAVALVSESPFVMRSYAYDVFTNVRRIGGTIQGEIDHATAGGTVLVRAGTYAESPMIDHSITLKSRSGKGATTIVLQPGPTYLGSLTLTGTGSNITVDGFTIQGFDAVGSGYASSNVYVTAGLGTVTVRNNRIRVGNVGAGSNGDDGIGLITDYNPASVTPSLTVDRNTFEPLAGVATRAFYINPSVDHFSFTNNTITGRFTGTALTQAKNGTVENNSVTGTGAVGSRSGGFATWGYPDRSVWGHTVFRGNTLTGTRGLRLYTASNTLVEKNSFNHNAYGITIDNESDASSIQAHRNSITGSDTFAAENDGAGVFDATCNWYGSASGPVATTLSGQVTFDPWLTTSNLAAACPSLRQLKMGVRGTLAALLPAATGTTADRLRRALAHLDASLASRLWSDDGTHLSNQGEDVFAADGDAIADLMKIDSGPAAAPVAQAVLALVNLDRQIAQAAIDDSRWREHRSDALAAMAQAAADLAAGHLDKAVAHYGDAWQQVANND